MDAVGQVGHECNEECYALTNRNHHDERTHAEARRVASNMAAHLHDIRAVRPDVVGRLRAELAAGHYAPPVDQVVDRLVRPILSRQPRITRWR